MLLRISWNVPRIHEMSYTGANKRQVGGIEYFLFSFLIWFRLPHTWSPRAVRVRDKNKNGDLTIVNLYHVTKTEKKRWKWKVKDTSKVDGRFFWLSSEGTRATCRTLDNRRRTATGVGHILKGFDIWWMKMVKFGEGA